MRIAVLGMSRMGQAVALRLVGRGHQVTVWNRTPDRAPEVVAAGAREAASTLDAVRGATSVHLALADDAAVEAVVIGEAGTLAPGLVDRLDAAVLVDHSTVAPATSRRMAEALGGAPMISAPILGPPQAVEDGLALYLLAGPKSAVESLAEVWESLSGSAHRFVGTDPGVATTMKVLANYLLMSGLATLSEAVATGQAAGLDEDTLTSFLSQLPLVAPALMNRLPALIEGHHDGWFSTTLGAKDVRLAVELAAAGGVEIPIAELVARRYAQAAAQGLADADITAVIELLR